MERGRAKARILAFIITESETTFEDIHGLVRHYLKIGKNKGRSDTNKYLKELQESGLIGSSKKDQTHSTFIPIVHDSPLQWFFEFIPVLFGDMQLYYAVHFYWGSLKRVELYYNSVLNLKFPHLEDNGTSELPSGSFVINPKAFKFLKERAYSRNFDFLENYIYLSWHYGLVAMKRVSENFAERHYYKFLLQNQQEFTNWER